MEGREISSGVKVSQWGNSGLRKTCEYFVTVAKVFVVVWLVSYQSVGNAVSYDTGRQRHAHHWEREHGTTRPGVWGLDRVMERLGVRGPSTEPTEKSVITPHVVGIRHKDEEDSFVQLPPAQVYNQPLSSTVHPNSSSEEDEEYYDDEYTDDPSTTTEAPTTTTQATTTTTQPTRTSVWTGYMNRRRADSRATITTQSPITSYSQWKWNKYGTRTGVDEQFRQSQSFPPVSPPQSKQRTNDAIAHVKKMLKYSCKKPLPLVVNVQKIHPHPNKVYSPHCTLLHVCSDDTGCCRESHTCAPKIEQRVELPFYVSIGRGPSIVQYLTFTNHTECECRDKNDEMMPRDEGYHDTTHNQHGPDDTLNIVNVDEPVRGKPRWVRHAVK